MRRTPLLLAALSLPLLVSFALQERVKPKEAKDFPALLTAARADWDSANYGRCVGKLNEALALALEKRADAIRAALPAGSEGLAIVPDERKNKGAGNPMLAAMSASVGNVVEQRYASEDGARRVEATVTADSPMVGMMSAWIANPAALGDNGELIKYGPHDAVLRTEGGGRLRLQVLVNDKHLCELVASGMTDEELFRFFDQKAVDALAAVLGS